MYFAVLDEQIRAASQGRRSLDDLLLAAVEHRRQGQAVTHDYWVDLLRAELGDAGPQGLEAMLNGALMLPGSSAFEVCFERTTAPLRRYELGFEPAALTESPRLVRGLIAGSAAEAAGVRNGDEIMKPVGQDGLQGDQAGLLTLSLNAETRCSTSPICRVAKPSTPGSGGSEPRTTAAREASFAEGD